MKRISLLYTLILFVITAHSQELWVGSYSPNSSYGIRLLSFNTVDGSLHIKDSIAVPQASFLVYSKKGILYAVEENVEGKVHAIRSNSMGGFDIFSSQSTQGMHPCYVALDHTEKWLTVGNYSSGNLTIYPIDENGGIMPASQTFQHLGNSINKSRQEGPHVHSTVFTPDNKYLLVPDLGIDQVKVYEFDQISGKLTPNTELDISFEKGGGPRHLSFHPNGKWLYILGELNGQVEVYEYNATGFKLMEKVSAIPTNFKGSFSAADIHITNDGKNLYLTLRDQLNSIVLFSIEENGRLKKKNSYSTGGKTPRNFYISKDDQWVLVENQNSHSIIVFKRDKKSGELEFVNHLENIIHPVCLIDR